PSGRDGTSTRHARYSPGCSLAPFPTRRPSDLFTEDRAHDFYLAYRESFGDRPGFPDPSEEEFLGWLHSDTEFRPEDSRVAYSRGDRKSTRLNSSHVKISYAAFCLKKKKRQALH